MAIGRYTPPVPISFWASMALSRMALEAWEEMTNPGPAPVFVRATAKAADPDAVAIEGPALLMGSGHEDAWDGRMVR